MALVVRAGPAAQAAQPTTERRRVAVGWSGVGAHERRCLRRAVGARARLTSGSSLTLSLSLLSGSNDGSSSRVVVWMVEERLDVRLKERIERIGDTVLLGELLGACKRDPDTLEVHSAHLDNDSFLFVLEDSVSLATRHAADVEELGTVDHVVVVSTSHAHATGIDLEAERTLVLPQRGGDTVSSGQRELGRVLGGGGIRGRSEVRRAVEVAVGAVAVHKVGRRVGVGMGGRVRSEMVAAVAITGVLSVMHHHAIDASVIGGTGGRRRGGSRGNVVSGTVGIAIAASILRVRVVAIGTWAAAVDRGCRVAIRRPARAVATVDRAGERAVRVSVVSRVVVVASVMLSVCLAVHGTRSRARSAAGSRRRYGARTHSGIGNSSCGDASVSAGHAGGSGRVGVAAIAVAVVEGRSGGHAGEKSCKKLTITRHADAAFDGR